MSMKKTIFACFSLLLFVFINATHAGLYKGLDADGNISYSDTPFENAEKITPPPISVIEPQKVPAADDENEDEKDSKQKETRYKKLKISSPKHQQTIWNTPDLTVAVQITPALDIKQGHRIWLLMDGKALVKRSKSTLMQITRADRGQHDLQVQVRNKSGKILKSSRKIIVHIKNSVIPRPSPR